LGPHRLLSHLEHDLVSIQYRLALASIHGLELVFSKTEPWPGCRGW
jgi:hypothetical protein